MDREELKSLFPVVVLIIILIFAFSEAEAALGKYRLSGIPIEHSKKSRIRDIKEAEKILQRIQNPIASAPRDSTKKSTSDNEEIDKTKPPSVVLKTAYFLDDEIAGLKKITYFDLIDWSKSSEILFKNRENLKKITVGIIKPNEFRIRIKREDLERILSNTEFAELKTHIPEGISVIRSKLVLKEKIHKQILEELSVVYETAPENLKVQLKRLHLHVPLKRIGELGSELEINSPHIKNGRLSNLLFRVFIKDSSGKTVEQSYASVKAEVQANIALSRKKLTSRESLNHSSVVFKWKPLPAIGKPIFLEENIEDLRIKRNLASGRILLRSDVEDEPMGEVGDRVSIHLNSGGLKVRSVGKLLDKAYLGKKVRVKNISTQRILEGRVVKPDLIEVVL